MVEGEFAISIGIITFMFFLALALPFLNEDLGLGAQEIDTSNLEGDVRAGLGDDTDVSDISALTIVFSVAKMFFWSYSFLPLWAVSIHILLRVFLLLILIKYIPFVG